MALLHPGSKALPGLATGRRHNYTKLQQTFRLLAAVLVASVSSVMHSCARTASSGFLDLGMRAVYVGLRFGTTGPYSNQSEMQDEISYVHQSAQRRIIEVPICGAKWVLVTPGFLQDASHHFEHT